VGIWNASTITPDFLRPTLEIGQGSQWAYMVTNI
jgi:hypothetical protein